MTGLIACVMLCMMVGSSRRLNVFVIARVTATLFVRTGGDVGLSAS